MANEIRPANVQMVGVKGDEVIVMSPRQVMTFDEALMHAAWLVALADGRGSHSFEEVRAAVEQT